jgi:hypothetical protein
MREKGFWTLFVAMAGVDVSRCTRVTMADIGECSVCAIAKAVWIDREAGVRLCEHCYGRGIKEDVRETRVG